MKVIQVYRGKSGHGLLFNSPYRLLPKYHSQYSGEDNINKNRAYIILHALFKTKCSTECQCDVAVVGGLLVCAGKEACGVVGFS